MLGQENKITETLLSPEAVVQSLSDEKIKMYYRFYHGLVVGEKYLCVIVKFQDEDAFIVTAYFTDQIKGGSGFMEKIKVWYDSEGDYLEVIFKQNEGYFRSTLVDQVMEKVDKEGNILGFSILKVSSLRSRPLEATLT